MWREGVRNFEKSMSGVGLGRLGDNLGIKNLTKTGIADIGEFWSGSEPTKSPPNGAR